MRIDPFLIMTACFLAACTQQPAPVTDRGFERFEQGRYAYRAEEDSLLRRVASRDSSGSGMMAAAEADRLTPASGTASAALIESVGVSELKPLAGPSSPSSSRSEPARPLLTREAETAQPRETLQMRSWLLSLVKQEAGTQAGATASPFRTAHFVWPAEGKLLSRFGPKPDGKTNEGVNIAVKEGAAVHAAAEGEVIYAGNAIPGFGTMVVIRHSGAWLSTYGHLSNLLVKRGQYVAQGQEIAEAGTTGQANAPQLHFSLRDGQEPVDPEKYLPKTVASGT